MKKIILTLICVSVALCAVSCYGDIDVVKQLSLTCKTTGFADGASSTKAEWGANETIYLFRAEDWSATLMSQISGEGSGVATFQGNAYGTRKGYYAVRPSSAAGAIRNSGDISIEVAPRNIFFAGDDSSVAIPQIGTGNSKNGLSFKSVFGALKFKVEGIASIAKVQALVPNQEHGLYGTFDYNLLAGTIADDNVVYKVVEEYAPALAVQGSKEVYLALPAGSYRSVDLLVFDGATKRKMLYSAENVNVSRGVATDVTNIVATEVSDVVGSWHIKSYCGAEAQVDLYMEFTANGTFVILQRTELSGYKKFVGTYSVDGVNSIISGKYSDGESWADSYKYSLDNEGNLLLQSVSNSSEISVYEVAEMPDVTAVGETRCEGVGSVKPL
jgi:hypothetical protein